MLRDVTGWELRTTNPDYFHSSILPTLALFVDGPIWLNATITALLVVTVLSFCVSALVKTGRRLRWFDRSQAVQLRRILRVSFGALFLGSMLLPYLVVEVPMVAASMVVFGLLVSIPYALEVPAHFTQSERATGDHPEVDS